MSEATIGSNVVTETVDDLVAQCRLCLADLDEHKTNIFEEYMKVDGDGTLLVADCLSDMFQIQFQRSTYLSEFICGRCLGLAKSSWTFREIVLNVNACIQELAAKPVTSLYGCPKPVDHVDENCTVIMLDPNNVYETSDDDFSMDSDSDEDSNREPTANSSTVGKTAPVNGAKSVGATKENPAGTPLAVAKIAELGAVTKITFMCQYCDIAFATQPDCAEHELLHDPQAPYLCNFCSMRHESRAGLISHIRAQHDAERPFICAVCNKGFCRRPDLKKHTIVHTGIRPFTCTLCNKSFSRNTNLTKHLRIHQSVKPFVCQNCPRSYSTELELSQHARTHTEVKPFNCNRCGASFTRRDKFVLHEQSHYRRDSEFLRNQGKGGGAAESVNYPVGGHMENMVVPLNPFATETHVAAQQYMTVLPDDPNRSNINMPGQGQQPIVQQRPRVRPSKFSRNFPCSVCHKSFTRQRDLHRHSALHMDTLFTCKECGMSFNRREKLARHEAQHHQPLPVTCQVCAVTFPTIDTLTAHMASHQNETPNNQIDTSSQQHAIPAAVPSLAPALYQDMAMQMNLGFYSEARPEDRGGL